jgi:hypothetical protein
VPVAYAAAAALSAFCPRSDYQCARQAGRVGGGDETPNFKWGRRRCFLLVLSSHNSAGLVLSAFAGGLNFGRIRGARRNNLEGCVRQNVDFIARGEFCVFFRPKNKLTLFILSDAKTCRVGSSKIRGKGIRNKSKSELVLAFMGSSSQAKYQQNVLKSFK